MSLKKPDIYGLREKHTQTFEGREGQDKAVDLALECVYSALACIPVFCPCQTDHFEVGDQEIYPFIHSLTHYRTKKSVKHILNTQ